MYIPSDDDEILFLWCNSTNGFELSILCTNGSDVSSAECIINDVNDKTGLTLRYIRGLWYLLVSCTGIFGNFAFLLSIPYAVRHKLHGLHKNFKTITFFVLHLSIADLCHCLVLFPYAIEQILQRWPFGTFLCKVVPYLYMIFSWCSVTSISLVFITVGRCIHLTSPHIWEQITRQWINLIILMILAWSISIAWTISFAFPTYGFETGWNCVSGTCATPSICHDTGSCSTELFQRRNEIYGLSLTAFQCLLMLSVMISYIIILIKCHQSMMDLKKIGNVCMGQLKKRESNTTRTVVLLTITYCLSNMAIIADGFVPSVDSGAARTSKTILVMIFEGQFLINVYIYLATNHQYKAAFAQCWKHLTCYLMSTCQFGSQSIGRSSTTTTANG